MRVKLSDCLIPAVYMLVGIGLVIFLHNYYQEPPDKIGPIFSGACIVVVIIAVMQGYIKSYLDSEESINKLEINFTILLFIISSLIVGTTTGIFSGIWSGLRTDDIKWKFSVTFAFYFTYCFAGVFFLVIDPYRKKMSKIKAE